MQLAAFCCAASCLLQNPAGSPSYYFKAMLVAIIENLIKLQLNETEQLRN